MMVLYGGNITIKFVTKLDLRPCVLEMDQATLIAGTHRGVFLCCKRHQLAQSLDYNPTNPGILIIIPITCLYSTLPWHSFFSFILDKNNQP